MLSLNYMRLFTANNNVKDKILSDLNIFVIKFLTTTANQSCEWTLLLYRILISYVRVSPAMTVSL